MKSCTVILLIILSVAVIAVVYKKKFRQQPDEIDRFENTLSGLDKVLPKDQAFSR